LARAVADAITVRAQISRRQGDMLHVGELHMVTCI
jgi:hypothetical protein